MGVGFEVRFLASFSSLVVPPSKQFRIILIGNWSLLGKGHGLTFPIMQMVVGLGAS